MEPWSYREDRDDEWAREGGGQGQPHKSPGGESRLENPPLHGPSVSSAQNSQGGHWVQHKEMIRDGRADHPGLRNKWEVRMDGFF